MNRVIVESPFAGEILRNIIYARFAMHDCLVNHEESPYASHLLYTQEHVLRDELPEERKLGIEAGFEWRGVADYSVFYTDLGVSSGMQLGMEDLTKKGREFKVRSLRESEGLWERFQHACAAEGLPIPE